MLGGAPLPVSRHAVQFTSRRLLVLPSSGRYALQAIWRRHLAARMLRPRQIRADAQRHLVEEVRFNCCEAQHDVQASSESGVIVVMIGPPILEIPEYSPRSLGLENLVQLNTINICELKQRFLHIDSSLVHLQ